VDGLNLTKEDLDRMSEQYREKLYRDWEYEVRKIAREATLNLKDMATYLYVENYYKPLTEELFKTEKSGEYVRRFLNEQGLKQ
jgi:hypothetical protein